MTKTPSALHLVDPSAEAVDRSTAAVIVVGLDGSPTSWDAFDWAAGEAARTHGRLIAVYVAPAVEPGAEYGAPIDFAAAEEAKDEIVEHSGPRCKSGPAISTSRSDSPGSSATRPPPSPAVARSVHADLIVVGRSSKMLHRLAGSLGRRLVSRHDTPAVVVVP